MQAAVRLEPRRMGQGLDRVSLCNLSPGPDTGIHGAAAVRSHQCHKARAGDEAETEAGAAGRTAPPEVTGGQLALLFLLSVLCNRFYSTVILACCLVDC